MVGMDSKKDFLSSAVKLAEDLDVDAHDIIVAYKKKPETLQAIFSKVSKTEGAVAESFFSCVIIGVLAALVTGPIALAVALPITILCAAVAADNNKMVLDTAHKMITAEIEKAKALPALPPPNLS